MKQDFYFTTTPRPDVELTLDDGRIFTGKRGAKLEKFAKVIQGKDQPQIVGMVLDGSLRELTYPLQKDGIASLITMAFSLCIELLLTRKVRSIDMVEALKSVE